MAEKHGSLSINSENIFPIIKKWLYSDHDIFARELISMVVMQLRSLRNLMLWVNTHFRMITKLKYKLL